MGIKLINNSLSELASQIGDVILKLHHHDFPEKLLHFVQSKLPFDHALILAYHEEVPPITLHKSYRGAEAERSLPEYIQSAYMLDPVFNAHLLGVRDGLYQLGEIAPDRFTNTAYYKTYYTKTGYTDEVLFLCKSKTGYTLALSLFKQNKLSHNFAKPAVTKLKALSPIICTLMQQHWSNVAAFESSTKTTPLSRRIKSAILESENVVLTERQSEIVALTLRGHSATSIGINLNISSETVKVHRRNIYARLRISSQSQLFSMVVNATGPLLN